MIQDRNVSSKDQSPSWWQPVVVLFARLSVWIVTPVFLGAFLGKYLDQKLGTGPLMMVIAVGFSFVISMAGLVMEATKEFKKIEDAEKEKKAKEEVDASLY